MKKQNIMIFLVLCDRIGKESWVTVFNISVENASCPRMNRENTAQSTRELTCMLEHIFQLDPLAHVTWLKVRRHLTSLVYVIKAHNTFISLCRTVAR